MKRFVNKVVVVTGASKGIGAGIATRFVQEGATVCINANEEAVHTVVQDLQKYGPAYGNVCDVTNKKDVEDFYATVVEKFGQVDVSVHNAGTITIAKIQDMQESEWDSVLNVNTKGVFLCSQAAAKIMMEQKSGCMINTASGQAREGLYTPRTMLQARWGLSVLRRAWQRNWLLLEYVSTHFVQGLSIQICGSTTIPIGENFLAIIDQGNS